MPEWYASYQFVMGFAFPYDDVLPFSSPRWVLEALRHICHEFYSCSLKTNDWHIQSSFNWLQATIKDLEFQSTKIENHFIFPHRRFVPQNNPFSELQKAVRRLKFHSNKIKNFTLKRLKIAHSRLLLDPARPVVTHQRGTMRGKRICLQILRISMPPIISQNYPHT